MTISCLDVIWAKHLHAAEETTLVEVHGLFHLTFGNKQVRHDTVNSHVQRMRRSKMMEHSIRCELEDALSLLELVDGTISSDHNAIEPNSLGM